MSALIIYKPNITNSHLAHIIYFECYFSQSGYKAFYKYTIAKCIDMLPKRSTLVDQTLGSESRHSQLSVAIFIAPRNLLGLRKVLYNKKVSKRYKSVYTPRKLSKTRDICESDRPSKVFEVSDSSSDLINVFNYSNLKRRGEL